MRQTFSQNLPKIANIPIYNAIIQILLNFSTYFCLFWENISEYYELKLKTGHRTNSCSEWDKNFPKNCQKFKTFLSGMQ